MVRLPSPDTTPPVALGLIALGLDLGFFFALVLFFAGCGVVLTEAAECGGRELDELDANRRASIELSKL